MKLAFYKASAGNVIDRVIDGLSGTARSGFSHVEAVFSDGVWFSSIGGTGPRFSPTIPYPEECWDFVEWPASPSEEEAMWCWAAKQVGSPTDTYDWRGDVNFLLPIGDDGHELFCSKAIVMLGQVAGFFPRLNPDEINPDVLKEIVTALGW